MSYKNNIVAGMSDIPTLPDGLPIDADDVEREMSTIARFMDAVGDSIKKGTPSKIERTRKSCMATVFNAEYIAQCSKEAIKYGDKVANIALDHIFGIELEEVKKMMGAIKRRIPDTTAIIWVDW